MLLEERLAKRIHERQQKNLFRKRLCVENSSSTHPLIDGKKVLSFSSNDYLGLSNHPEIVSEFKKAADIYGVGAGASHLITGHKKPHFELEEALADFTGYPKTLLFSCGYMANAGIASALLQRKDTVYHDKLNHASLLDAVLHQKVNSFRYRHKDHDHLNVLISSKKNNAFIVTDGVFSMDGDIADLKSLSVLAEKNHADLWVDDAHGFGVLGENGRGSVEHFQLKNKQVPILMATLGKAVGVSGAFVAGSETLIESLVQFSRNYVYTTAMPAAVAQACSASLKLIQNESWRKEKVLKLSKRLQINLLQAGFKAEKSESAIVPLILGESKNAVSLSEKLMQNGIYVTAIRPPTVAEGTSRLRFTLSANHEEEEVDFLVDTLMKVSG